MLLTVKILTGERMSLVVPESAITEVANDSFVFVAGKDGKVSKQSIKVGARRFGYVEVTEGLKDGDRVITEGSFKIREGMPVRIQEQSGATGAGKEGGFATENAEAGAPG